MKYWLRRLFQLEQTERQLDSELQFHLEQRTEDLMRSGMSASDARRQAQLEFGGTEAVKEQCRESRRIHLVETLLQDVRYGFRWLRRSPGFTAIALLTLTLGIGMNTAIFSVVNGVLLNPLPFPDPDRLITLHESKPNFANGSISYPNFRDWQKDNHSFSSVAINRGYAFSLTGMGDAEQLNGQFISADFFSLLSVHPVLGRMLRPGEDEIGAAPVVQISAGLWKRKFASSPGVLGRTLTLDAKRYSIIGVVPVDIPQLAAVGIRKADVFVPIGQWTNNLLPSRAAGLGIHGIGRLRDGVTLEQARADMERVTANLTAAYPDVNKGVGASLIPLKRMVVGQVKPYLLLLLASVGFVLLIACVNVANLLLARSLARKREFAIRRALGAATSRIVRQMLTESILLGLCGGILGLAIAAWATPVMLKVLPSALPRVTEISIDVRVLAVNLVISLASGVLFGLAPAFKMAREDMFARMKDGGLAAGPVRYRAQNALAAIEVAMALVLLVGAGLMVRTLLHLWNVDTGFNSHNVLSFGLSLPPASVQASPEAIRAQFREVESRLSAIPGVQATSYAWGAIPLKGDDEELFWMEGAPRPTSPNDMKWALSYVVGPDYLRVMQTPLLRGRFLNSQDDEHSPLVVVIDESLAAAFFPNQDPIGKRLNLESHDRPAEIVGVVKHVKQWGLDNDEQSLQPQLYRSFMQLPDKPMSQAGTGTGVIVRSTTEASVMFENIRAALHRMNADQVVFGPQTMDEAIAASLAARRYSMILLTSFASLALLLAGIGIYGVISYGVGQRTQEIGIRMALGASRLNVLRLILYQGAKLAFAGLMLGLAATLALSRLISGMLYGVAATDPVTFLAVSILLAITALLACYLPARRATKVDPMRALRWE